MQLFFTEQTSPFKERDDKLLSLHSLHHPIPPKKNKPKKQLEMMSLSGDNVF